MKAVLDTNVIISAVLSPAGSPARVLRLWIEGAYELVCSPLLLAELERTFAYPKLRARIRYEEGAELIDLLHRGALMLEDPTGPPEISSPDPGDDYLIALAAEAKAAIVTGDRHLLGLSEEIPVYSPFDFLGLLQQGA